MLLKHGRIDLIDEVREVVVQVREESAGQQRVQVRSAQPLTETSRKRVSFLAHLLHFRLENLNLLHLPLATILCCHLVVKNTTLNKTLKKIHMLYTKLMPVHCGNS